MTDSKTATERLREMLDARGMRYEKSEDDTTIYYDEGKRYTYSINPESGWAQLFGYHLTPEQAIAATLGSGTLTAEQVSKAIERNFGKVAVLDDGKPVEWRDDWVCNVGINYRAIADELNATLGSGECEAIHDTHYYIGINGICEGLYCSECGEPLSSKFRHCPWCGAKVVER